MPSRRRAILAVGALWLVTSILTACKIVPLAGDGASAPAGFSATAYADGLWVDKVLPYLNESARPLPEVLAAISTDLNEAGGKFGYRPATEGSPWTFIVSGTGAVTSKNTKSRAGTLTLVLDGATPSSEVAVQIGPVVRGNAIRDSLPFVSFKDFTNQLEYADVGKEFNALALEAIKADVEAIIEGQKVSFVGAMSLNTKSDKIIITPVSLKAAK